MKEKRSTAKDGGNSTDKAMKVMRERYDRATEADQENRDKAREDLLFVTVPGHQWDETQRKARKGRPCYEFPILRSHWRQVVNDQKQARPGIKVRAVEDADGKGAELRQGILNNLQSVSNADRAYDSAFELLTAAGFGAWRITTEYSEECGWEQDIRVKAIADPLNCVWFDPDAKEPDCRDGMWAFVEETMSRDAFERRYPDAEAVDFESAKKQGCSGWFGQDSVRVAEYWRKVPVTKTLLLLSDGRTVDSEEVANIVDELVQAGVTVTRERQVKTYKVVTSIVSGTEEIDGPHDWIGTRIPIIPVYGNRHFVEGKWTWCGMVRFSRDPQKLVNYNLTTAQEVLAKQAKATPIVTPKMLEGDGVKALWDRSNAMDAPYLPITPDPQMPGGPSYLSAPPIHAAFAQFGEMAIDMLKASDGIYDASVGNRSNETSGKAILARQREGDTATFDYQDSLSAGIQSTGEILIELLPKVYDTPRAMRVLGKDGAEDWVKLYEEVQDQQTGEMTVVNDLGAGKYDVTVSTGPAFSTQRAEFVDLMMNMAQGNPALMEIAGDIVFKSMDFPHAEEVGERLKLMLPPPIQQSLNEKDESPAVAQLKGQLEQMKQAGDQQFQQMGEALQQAEKQAASNEANVIKARTDAERVEIDWYEARTRRLSVLQKDMHVEQEAEFHAQEYSDNLAREAMEREQAAAQTPEPTET